MNRRIFKHEKTDLGYEDLIAESTSSGRKYATPDGNRYPSVTTVLSILSEEFIQRWRARVGAEEANRISHRASTRGTAVHSIIEKYKQTHKQIRTHKAENYANIFIIPTFSISMNSSSSSVPLAPPIFSLTY